MTDHWTPDPEFAALMRSVDKDVQPAKWRLYWWLTRAIKFLIPPVVVVILLLAGVTAQHRHEFNTQYDGCESAVAAGRDTIEQAHVEATRRGGAGAASGRYPGLAAAFDSMHAKCFDQKYLSALQHDRAQFDTARAGALDAWRYATQPASLGPGEAGPTREDQLTDAALTFLDSTLLPHLHGIKAPTIWETVQGFVD